MARERDSSPQYFSSSLANVRDYFSVHNINLNLLVFYNSAFTIKYVKIYLTNLLENEVLYDTK